MSGMDGSFILYNNHQYWILRRSTIWEVYFSKQNQETKQNKNKKTKNKTNKNKNKKQSKTKQQQQNKTKKKKKKKEKKPTILTFWLFFMSQTGLLFIICN